MFRAAVNSEIPALLKQRGRFRERHFISILVQRLLLFTNEKTRKWQFNTYICLILVLHLRELRLYTLSSRYTQETASCHALSLIGSRQPRKRNQFFQSIQLHLTQSISFSPSSVISSFAAKALKQRAEGKAKIRSVILRFRLTA